MCMVMLRTVPRTVASENYSIAEGQPVCEYLNAHANYPSKYFILGI